MLKKYEIESLQKYFDAANYISACQLYLLDNPLLKRKLEMSDIKKKLVGHWGTVPSQNFIYTNLNYIIKKHNLDMIYISGPGHGGNAMVANTYIEGTYSKIYPNITEDEDGLKKLFKQFSFPGGIPSHAAPETPGSINEGGELGYSVAHAYGAILDNPNLIASCVIGDGEMETGPLATSLHLNKFINPEKDGFVLPILNLNGYKIANPSIFARISEEELKNLIYGYGYEPIIVDANLFNPFDSMQKALEYSIKRFQKIKSEYLKGKYKRFYYPFIILKSPKGWTGPKVVDNKKIEGTFRAHQVPLTIDNDEDLNLLYEWLKSYHPENLFDAKGKLKKDVKWILPVDSKKMGASPYANGGLKPKKLILPNFIDYEVKCNHGDVKTQDMMELSKYLRDVIKNNQNNFRLFAPDETLSNRLNHVFEETSRQFEGNIYSYDEYLNNEGRVIDSFLSEHVCEGLLEGYILTGRHGIFDSYEAFVRIIDSMASQHAKWLKMCNQISWRKDIPSLNYILTSHIWQQDHNGYTHQDPGFLNHMVTKKSEIVRIYLPIDANTLISTVDHCLNTENYINVVVASKHPSFQWLSMKEAINHCTKGIDTFKWCSNDEGNPDVVLASCGDTPNIEVIAASTILREKLPKLKVRVVNVIDLMRLVSNDKHPHGLTNSEYNKLFTKDKPIIFAFHGYPNLIHELTYNRDNQNMHVFGYMEEGTITTPFDMRVQNKIDRFNLVISTLKYVKIKGKEDVIKYCEDMLKKHSTYIKKYGIDLKEVRDWTFKK